MASGVRVGEEEQRRIMKLCSSHAPQCRTEERDQEVKLSHEGELWGKGGAALQSFLLLWLIILVPVLSDLRYLLMSLSS
jgi:hypothetical protein